MKSSVGQVSRRLPKDFIEKLYELFPQHTAETILAGCGVKRLTTLRVNTLKTDVRTVMSEFRESNIKFERVAWYEDALIIINKKEKDLEQLELYKQGAIYLQSLSSMIPPLVLDPQPGERVLDLTAAPGSKTTQMAAMMKNSGYILANDINEIRAEVLSFNVAAQSASIVEVSRKDGKLIGRDQPESFDKVLLDAPCSGEGLFLCDDARTYRSWSERNVKTLASEQKKLFSSAYKALKQGGVMVYSTCTIGPSENEMVVDWALRELPGLKTENISLSVQGAQPGISQFRETELSPEVKKCLRVLPSETLEGFFICRLKKT